MARGKPARRDDPGPAAHNGRTGPPTVQGAPRVDEAPTADERPIPAEAGIDVVGPTPPPVTEKRPAGDREERVGPTAERIYRGATRICAGLSENRNLTDEAVRLREIGDLLVDFFKAAAPDDRAIWAGRTAYRLARDRLLKGIDRIDVRLLARLDSAIHTTEGIILSAGAEELSNSFVGLGEALYAVVSAIADSYPNDVNVERDHRFHDNSVWFSVNSVTSACGSSMPTGRCWPPSCIPSRTPAAVAATAGPPGHHPALASRDAHPPLRHDVSASPSRMAPNAALDSPTHPRRQARHLHRLGDPARGRR